LKYGKEKVQMCNFCGREFKSYKALLAHLRFCPERTISIRKKEKAEEKERRYRKDNPFRWVEKVFNFKFQTCLKKAIIKYTLVSISQYLIHLNFNRSKFEKFYM
jgi:hypothetical protein